MACPRAPSECVCRLNWGGTHFCSSRTSTTNGTSWVRLSESFDKAAGRPCFCEISVSRRTQEPQCSPGLKWSFVASSFRSPSAVAEAAAKSTVSNNTDLSFPSFGSNGSVACRSMRRVAYTAAAEASPHLLSASISRRVPRSTCFSRFAVSRIGSAVGSNIAMSKYSSVILSTARRAGSAHVRFASSPRS